MAAVVKLKDIADATSVSVATVSNALSGKKGVSREMRQKIQKTAQELGYDISKYEKKDIGNVKIGVLMAEKYLWGKIPFYWELYQQVVRAVAGKSGITVFEEIIQDMPEEGRLPGILSKGETDGVLIIGWMGKSYTRRMIHASGVPVVLLDCYDEELECDAVLSHNYIGMYKATKYLLEHGHRDIAFVGSLDGNENIMDRYYGYRKGLAEWGIPIRQDWVLEDRNTRTGEIHIELPRHLPTAFACNCDYAAGYLYDRLQEQGYHVPEDISIVGYDDYMHGHPFAREITTYHVDMEKMAWTAVDILLKRLKKTEGQHRVVYVDSGMVERNSVRELHRR